MLLDKIIREHVLQAIQEIDENGIEKGAHSSTYDVVYNNKRYPPKLVISLANKYANGEVLPRDTFHGGPSHPAFKLLDKLGFKIDKKITMDNRKLYELKNSFLKEWPIERLKTMTLEDYTNLDKTSFCYWIEAITTDIGSIWGGSAYKFGIFKRKDLESENYNDKRKSDGDYAWYGKYGDTRQEVFERVKETVINIATLSLNNNLKQIDQIDFGDGIKWKIAFLYGDYNIIDIFNHNALKTSAKYLGYEGKDQSYPALNEYILSQKGEKDYFDFAKELWEVFEKDNTLADEFEKKFDFFEILQDFLKQAKTGDLKTKTYPKSYGGLKVKVSFGAGNQALQRRCEAFLEDAIKSNY